MKDGLHSRTSSSSRSRVEEINFRDVPRVDIESACSRLLAPSRGAEPTGCAGILSWFHHPLDMCSWDETKVPNQNIQAETQRLIWPVEHQKGKLIINCDYLRGVFQNVWTEEGRRLKSVHTQGSVHLSLLWIHIFFLFVQCLFSFLSCSHIHPRLLSSNFLFFLPSKSTASFPKVTVKVTLIACYKGKLCCMCDRSYPLTHTHTRTHVSVQPHSCFSSSPNSPFHTSENLSEGQ